MYIHVFYQGKSRSKIKLFSCQQALFFRFCMSGCDLDGKGIWEERIVAIGEKPEQDSLLVGYVQSYKPDLLEH